MLCTTSHAIATNTDLGIAGLTSEEREEAGRRSLGKHNKEECVMCWYVAICYYRVLLGGSWTTDCLADCKGPPPCFGLCVESGYRALHEAQHLAAPSADQAGDAGADQACDASSQNKHQKQTVLRNLQAKSKQLVRDHCFPLHDQAQVQKLELNKLIQEGKATVAEKLVFPFDNSIGAANTIRLRFLSAMEKSKQTPRLWAPPGVVGNAGVAEEEDGAGAASGSRDVSTLDTYHEYKTRGKKGAVTKATRRMTSIPPRCMLSCDQSCPLNHTQGATHVSCAGTPHCATSVMRRGTHGRKPRRGRTEDPQAALGCAQPRAGRTCKRHSWRPMMLLGCATHQL